MRIELFKNGEITVEMPVEWALGFLAMAEPLLDGRLTTEETTILRAIRSAVDEIRHGWSP